MIGSIPRAAHLRHQRGNQGSNQGGNQRGNQGGNTEAIRVVMIGSMARAAHMSMTSNGPQPPMSEYESPYLGTHSTGRFQIGPVHRYHILEDGRARNQSVTGVSGHHQGVIRASSGRHQGVIRASSGRHQGVIRASRRHER